MDFLVLKKGLVDKGSFPAMHGCLHKASNVVILAPILDLALLVLRPCSLRFARYTLRLKVTFQIQRTVMQSSGNRSTGAMKSIIGIG